MKSSMKRILALVLSLMLLIPALAEDSEQTEPEVVLEELVIPEEDELGNVELELELDDEIGVPADLSVEDFLEVPEIEDIDEAVDEAVEDALEETTEADGTLADNAGETVRVRYIDARGKDQGEKTCIKVRAGNENRSLGTGWYAVTGNVRYGNGMIIYGDVNLILCDGASLISTDGIWVQQKASLTIWAQSTGKNMGKIVSSGYAGGTSYVKKKAGIGGIENEVAGAIIINGGDIYARSGSNGSSGIGGGYGEKSGYTRIEINGGKVYTTTSPAQYHAGSGIGSGYKNEYIGTISITGGTVKAIGNRTGAGIGSALEEYLAGTVNITGGKVVALNSWGPGISGDKVTISVDEAKGEYVKAYGGDNGAGITGNVITIDSGKVIAEGGENGAGMWRLERK